MLEVIDCYTDVNGRHTRTRWPYTYFKDPEAANEWYWHVSGRDGYRNDDLVVYYWGQSVFVVNVYTIAHWEDRPARSH